MTQIIYTLVSIAFFYFLYKFLFILAYKDFTSRYLFQNKKELIKFIINPYLIKQYKTDRYFSLYYYLSFLLSFVWGLLLSFRFNVLADLFKINFTIAFIYIVILAIFIGFLLYLAIFDTISFSIPELISKRMILFAASANVLFLILKLVLSTTEYSYIFGLINLGSLFNLLGGLIGGGIIWAIVKISKEKAMGAGDIDILASIGLILGIPSLFYSFFYTLMAASIISIVYVLIIRKYKGVLIPFVPFLASGFILCFVLGDAFLRLFSIY